jgi:hypothetical protein
MTIAYYYVLLRITTYYYVLLRITTYILEKNRKLLDLYCKMRLLSLYYRLLLHITSQLLRIASELRNRYYYLLLDYCKLCRL